MNEEPTNQNPGAAGSPRAAQPTLSPEAEAELAAVRQAETDGQAAYHAAIRAQVREGDPGYEEAMANLMATDQAYQAAHAARAAVESRHGVKPAAPLHVVRTSRAHGSPITAPRDVPRPRSAPPASDPMPERSRPATAPKPKTRTKAEIDERRRKMREAYRTLGCDPPLSPPSARLMHEFVGALETDGFDFAAEIIPMLRGVRPVADWRRIDWARLRRERERMIGERVVRVAEALADREATDTLH